MSALFHFAEKGIPVIGPVPGGLPSLGLPDVTWSDAVRDLLSKYATPNGVLMPAAVWIVSAHSENRS